VGENKKYSRKKKKGGLNNYKQTTRSAFNGKLESANKEWCKLGGGGGIEAKKA